MSRGDRHGFAENNLMCCGMAEYDGLNKAYGFKAKKALYSIAADMNYADSDRDMEGGCSHIILTQMYHPETKAKEGCKNLNALIRYVKRYKLGEFAVAPVRTNPNSGNKIKAAIFTPDVKAFREWALHQGIVDYTAERAREEKQWRSRQDSFDSPLPEYDLW